MSDQFSFPGETEQERRIKEQKLTEAYRTVFNTPYGKAVLTDILNDLGFLSGLIEDEQDRILNNYARTLLRKIGVWQGQNLYYLTDAMLKDIPWATIPEEEETHGR